MNPDENKVPRAGGGAPQKIKRNARRRSPILQAKVLIPMFAGLLGLVGMIIAGVVLSEDEAGESITAVAEMPAPETVHDPRYVQPTEAPSSAVDDDSGEQAEGPILSLTADVENRLESIGTEEETADQDLAGKKDQAEAAARVIMEAYQDAKTPEDLIPLVRHPEITAPLMREFYARPGNRLEKLSLGEGALGMVPYELGGQEYIVAQMRWEDFSQCFAVLEWDGTRYRLDWQTLVEYDSFPWERFVKERPITQERFRVLASPDDYYVGPFEDADEFQCLRLSKGREEGALYAYFRKGNPELEQLETLLRDTLSFPVAIIVDLSFVSQGLRNQVILENLDGVGWVEAN